MRLARFHCILHETEWPLVLQRPRQSTYLILSRLSDRLIFCTSLSLQSQGWYFRKKTSTCRSTLLRIALRVSTCIIHVHLAESRPEGQGLVSSK